MALCVLGVLGVLDARATTVTASRNVPAYYIPDTPVTVTINVSSEGTTPPCGLIIEEFPPAGWTVESASPEFDQILSSNGRARLLFTDAEGIDTTRTLSYTVYAPAGQSGSKSFTGDVYYLTDDVETSGSISGTTLIPEQSAPTFTGASISPSPAYATDWLTVTAEGWSDAEGHSERYVYQWKKGGETIPYATGKTLTNDFFDEGDAVSCAVTAYDGHRYGNTITPSTTIQNVPPDFDGLTTATADGHSVLLEWDAAPDDSPPVTYNVYLAPTPGGQNFSAPDYSTPDTSFRVNEVFSGETLHIVVRAEDRYGNEDTNTVEHAVTTDAPPPGSIEARRDLPPNYVAGSTASVFILFDIDPSVSIHGLILEETIPVGWEIVDSNYPVDVFDKLTGEARWLLTDKDDLILSRLEYTAHVPDGETGARTFSGNVSVIVEDVETLVPVEWEDTISDVPTNQIPYFDLAVIVPDPARKQDTLSIVTAGWDDYEGDPEGYFYQWRVNGEDVPGQTSSTLSFAYFEEGETVTCEVTAWDGKDRGAVIVTPPTTIQRVPPVFAGLESVSSGDGYMDLTWSAAWDESPPITYNIYEAASPGGQDFASTPTYTTRNPDGFRTEALINNRPYFYVVRAEDRRENEDGNLAEIGGVPLSALVRPVFEGSLTGIARPGLYSGGSSYARPLAVDLDDDGDVDVIVGEGDGTLTFWQNVGTLTSPNWSAPVHNYGGIDVGAYAAPAAGDVDGDGDLDLVIGRSEGDLVLSENVGDRETPGWGPTEAGFADIDVVTKSVPAFGDFDGDGDPDLVVGRDDGSFDFAENLGSGLWGPQLNNYTGHDVTNVSAPWVADVDGDGDLDILAGQGDGTLTLIENTGSVSEPEWAAAVLGDWEGVAVGQWSKPTVADLDDDGRFDLIIGNRRGEVHSFLRGAEGLRNLSGNFTFIDVGDESAPTHGDLDGDGDLDAVVGASDGRLTFLRNIGNAITVQWDAPVENYAGIDVGANSAPDLFDLNGDGLLDLIVGEQNGELKYFENKGTADTPAFDPIPDAPDLAGVDAYYFSVPRLTDLDADGDGDLLVGGWLGEIVYCENIGDAQTPQWGAPQTGYAGVYVDSRAVPAVGDVDGDGTLDIMVGRDDGTLVVVYNSGTPASPSWRPPETLFGGIDVGDRSYPALADLDGDGDVDLVMGERQGGVNYQRNMMFHLKVTPRATTLLAGESQLFAVHDVTSPSLTWQIVKNASGGSLAVVNDSGMEYTAGAVGGPDIYDVIEVSDRSRERVFTARVYVNVLRPEDRASVGKALICAGRKDASDTVWPATDYLSRLAYRNLLLKGYSRDDIYYLSPVTGVDVDGDGDPNNDVDALSTLPNLENALTTWSAQTHELTAYFVDHGWTDGNGEAHFRLNAGTGNVLTGSQLDGWLDDLQTATTMTQNVIIDCCYSGAFIPALTPPPDRRRLVAASCSDSELTCFVAQGLISFSEAFWNSVFSGNSLGQAFVVARDAMDRYQSAWFDDNGDGRYDPDNDSGPDTVAWGVHLGLSNVVGADRPQIGRVVSNQTLAPGETSALLWTDDVTGVYPIERVWAVVVPPNFQPPPDSVDPVLDLPQIDFAFNLVNDRWEAAYTSFTQTGSYKVIVYAEDVWESVSLPKQVYVHKSEMNEKAIVLVGATPYEPQVPMAASYYLGDWTYRTLRNRGFAPQAIRYLSDELNNPDVVSSPTLENFENALSQCAGDVVQLTVYMVGEGSTDSFRLNADEMLSAGALDQLLDEFQTTSSARAIVLIEAKGAGAFLDELASQAEQERVVLASSSPNGPSYCLEEGVLSFSQYFLSRVFDGANVKKSFSDARLAVKTMCDPEQTPLLEDDGDGVATKDDGTLAHDTFIGAAFLTGGDDLPTIGDHTPDCEVRSNQALDLWASGVFDTDGVASVRAIVVPRQPLDPNEAVTVPLAFSASNGRWEASYATTTLGQYTICFVAMDNEGNNSPFQQSVAQVKPNDLPEPPTGTIEIEGGAAATNSRDVTLNLTSSGATEMRFRNGLGAWGDWRAFSAITTWTLTAGDGMKTVDAEFRDAYEQVSAAPVSDSIVLDMTPPDVAAVLRADANPTSAAAVRFDVRFTEGVTGVDIADFVLSTDNLPQALLADVASSGATWVVTVVPGRGKGALRLDVTDDDSIVDAAGNPLGGPGAGTWRYGETYDAASAHYLAINSPRGNPQGEGWYIFDDIACWSVDSPVLQGEAERWSALPSSGCLTVDNDTTVTVIWTLQFRLTTIALPAHGGETSPVLKWVDEQDQTTLLATPSPPYRFVVWQGDVASTNPQPLILVNAPMEATALFGLPGDVSLDDTITSADIQLLADRLIFESLPGIPSETWTLGDLNEDGKICVGDLILLIQTVGGSREARDD